MRADEGPRKKTSSEDPNFWGVSSSSSRPRSRDEDRGLLDEEDTLRTMDMMSYEMSRSNKDDPTTSVMMMSNGHNMRCWQLTKEKNRTGLKLSLLMR